MSRTPAGPASAKATKARQRAPSSGATTPSITTRNRAPAPAPAPEPAAASEPSVTVVREAARQPGTSNAGVKLLILGEMAALWTAALTIEAGGSPVLWATALEKRNLKRTLAIVLLLGGLLFLADIGLGAPAAVFGGVILVSYLTANSGRFSTQLAALQGRYA